MHAPQWLLSAGATVFVIIVAPIVKDACSEWWKRRLGHADKERVDNAIVKVAQIEAEQGRETRVNSEVWRLMDELKDEVENLRHRLESSEQRNAVQAAEIENLQARLKLFEKLSRENTTLRGKVKKLQAELDQAKAELQGRRISEQKSIVSETT